MEVENAENFPFILNGDFFKVISAEDKDDMLESDQDQIKAKCMLCGPKQTVISSTKTSTGNFFKHLRVT